METFAVTVNTVVNRPVAVVYGAIVDPQQLTGFFISKAIGEFVPGSTVSWLFEDVGAQCEVEVQQLIENKEIRFAWNAVGQEPLSVNIVLSSPSKEQTKIEITETPFILTKEGVQKAMGQTQGWTDFCCSLKAYLYTGINLRSGK